jgi:hypothetical protein
VIRLLQYESIKGLGALADMEALPPKLKTERTIWPKATARAPVPATLTPALAEDYTEACNVLPDSP